MAVVSPDDPVALFMRMRGIPMTGENYQRTQQGLRVGGWNGGNQPISSQVERQAYGSLPDRQSAAEPQSGEQASPIDDQSQYLDDIAGRSVQSRDLPPVTDGMSPPDKSAAAQKSGTTNPAAADAKTTANEGADGAAMPDGASNSNKEMSMGDMVTSLLGALGLGGVGYALMRGKNATPGMGASAAAVDSQPVTTSRQLQLEGPNRLAELPAAPDMKQLPAPDTMYAGAPQEPLGLPKPRHRVQAGSSREAAISSITKRGRKLDAARAAARMIK